MNEGTPPNLGNIEPGMLAEATEGDLGESDLSKPEVSGVIEDPSGQVQAIVIKKGLLFKKEIQVPAERVRSVEEGLAGDPPSLGKVIIEAQEAEIESLAAAGMEPLPPEERAEAFSHSACPTQVEQVTPDEIGLSQRPQMARSSVADRERMTPNSKLVPTGVLGSGFIAGISGKDSSAVTTYAVDGASVGYGHLWIILIATPLLQAVQFACAKVGRIQQKGLAEVLRDHYGRRVAFPAALLLALVNLAMVAANLVAISSGLELVLGVSWVWFVGPVAATLWYIIVYRDYDAIKKVFLVMSLAFLAYIATALLARPDWGAVLSNTFIPNLDLSLASISSAVGLLGATISPYTLFWQVQSENEERRSGDRKEQLRIAGLDIASGVVTSNLVAYSIIVSTSATIFSQHRSITTAIDAARAFEPLLGPLAKYLYAVGLIGAGLIAIPILLASTSYAVAGTVGWPAGLSRKPWQSEGFYLIFTVALIVSLAIAFLGLDPIGLMFWANVLQGLLTPVLISLILMVGNNRELMKGMPLNRATNLGLLVTAAIMYVGAALLLYGMASRG